MSRLSFFDIKHGAIKSFIFKKFEGKIIDEKNFNLISKSTLIINIILSPCDLLSDIEFSSDFKRIVEYFEIPVKTIPEYNIWINELIEEYVFDKKLIKMCYNDRIEFEES